MALSCPTSEMEKRASTTMLEPVIETIDNLLAFYQQDCQRWLCDTRARLEEPEAVDVEESTPSSPLGDVKPEPEDGTISECSTLPPKQSIKRRRKLQAELKSARLIRPAPQSSADDGESSCAPRNILDVYQKMMKSRMHSVTRTRYAGSFHCHY